jgi:hypothetical protein
VAEGIKEGSADITKMVSKAFLVDDAGNIMMSNILTALRAGATDITYTMQKAIDDVKLDSLIADVDARAAAQSSAGYNLASKTAGTTGTAQEPLTAPSNITVATQAKQAAGTTTAAVGKTITIDADLKLTDKAGQIIAEVVNSYNKKIEVGVGG